VEYSPEVNDGHNRINEKRKLHHTSVPDTVRVPELSEDHFDELCLVKTGDVKALQHIAEVLERIVLSVEPVEANIADNEVALILGSF